MKKLLRALGWAGLILSLLGYPWDGVVHAASGTVTVTRTQLGSQYVLFAIAWTSTAGGAVSGNTLGIGRGKIIQVEFVPSASNAPTDLYDAQLNDSYGTVNVLSTGGDNLSATTSKILQLVPPFYVDGVMTLDLVIANAGASKQGTVYVVEEIQ